MREIVEWLAVGLLLAACLAAAALVQGCGGGDGGEDGSPASLIGGGPTRHWRGRDHTADARALAAHGGTAIALELNECVRGRQRRAKGSPDEWCPDPVEAGARVRAMRAHGVTTLVNVVNGNGLLEQSISPEIFAELVEGFRREAGSTDRVILSAVSEPFVSRFEKWRGITALGRSLWPGELAMPTRSGAGADLSPAFPEIPHEWIDFHPCSDRLALAALGVPGVIVNTDCRDMMDVGPGRARPLIRRAIETGGPLVFYGGPGQTDLSPTLAVIGEELSR